MTAPATTRPAVDRLLRLDGRRALVTGAGAGIGSAIARRFAEAGARVGVGYRTSESEAARLVEEIRSAGGSADAFRADVSLEDEVEGLFDALTDRWEGLDILVNNAGIYPVTPFLDMSEREWDATLEADLRSVFLCSRAAGRRMGTGGGAIVNVASIEGERPAPGHSHYSAAKAAVLMHTRAVAAELGPRGIRVNAVSPGLIGRPGIEEEWREGVERWRARCPLGRLGEAADVADACLFLASDAARWITAANLVVDGGALAAPTF